MNMKKKASTLAFLTGIAAFGVTAQSALAASIYINDTLPGGSITVTGGQFEYGFSVNGSQIQSPSNTATGSTTVSEASGPFNFNGTWITNNAPMPFSSQVLFLDSTNNNLVSDILNLSYAANSDGTATINGSFQSGNLGLLSSYSGYTGTFVEGSGNYNFSAPYLSGVVASTNDVPGPSSFLMLATGLVAMGLVRFKGTRNSKKKALAV